MTIPQTIPEPRLWTLEQVANCMGLERQSLEQVLPAMRKRGFPNAIPGVGRWDRKIVDAWLDHLSGLRSERVGFYPAAAAMLAPEGIRPTENLPAELRSPGSFTVGEAIGAYMEWMRDHRKSARSAQYSCDAYILPHFGHRAVADLRAPQIRAWHQAMANSPKRRHVGFGQPPQFMPPPKTDDEKRRRRHTANRNLMILKAALNMAVREGQVVNDTAWRNVRAFRDVVLEKATYLSIEDCRRLLKLVAGDFRRLVRAGLYTGARLMELARMKAGDYNPQAGTIHFPRTKTAHGRQVSLTEEGQQFFSELTTNLHPTDLILRRGDGNGWRAQDPGHRLRAACDAAGIPEFTFHTLRHTYASWLVMAGTPIAVVAKNLGHATTASCDKFYAHLSPEYLGAEVRERMPAMGFDERT
jgi:integrase